MKGHTRATLLLGKGAIYSGSWKQRLVARSSTKSKLIGVYDILPQVLWTKQFLEDWGGWIQQPWSTKTIPVQFCWKRTARVQAQKGTKHMHIQYFYVMEQVQQKAIHVTHCLTEEMVTDFFTKPLQGSLFVKIHEYIMDGK